MNFKNENKTDVKKTLLEAQKYFQKRTGQEELGKIMFRRIRENHLLYENTYLLGEF